jgi:hypothetical protein
MYNPIDAYETDDYLIGKYTDSILETLDLNILVNSAMSDQWIRGRYVMCATKSGREYWFTIYDDGDALNDDVRTLSLYSGTIDIIAEDANPIVKPDSAKSFEYYFNLIFYDTGIVLGINEISNLNRQLEYTSTDVSNAEMLQYVLNGFDNAEAELVPEFDGTTVTKLVLNVYKQLGESEPVALLTDEDDSLTELTRKGSISELATCINPVGAEVDGNEITLAGKYYEERDTKTGELLYYSPKTHTRIYSVKAHQEYFVNLPEKNSGEFDGYMNRKYESQAKTQDTLWTESLAQLKKIDHAKIEYTAKGSFDGNIGDYVYITSHKMKPIVTVSSRMVVKKFNDDDDSRNEYEFSNFVELESKLDDLSTIMAKLKKEINYVLDVETHYCTSTQGDTPPDIGWVTTIPTLEAGQWLWTRTTTNMTNGEASLNYTKVKNGEDGRGIKGEPELSYAKSESGTTPPTTWQSSIPDVPAGQYLWTKEVTTYTDGEKSSRVTPTLMGATGSAGIGITDKEVVYQAGASGTKAPTGTWVATPPTVAANQYLWTRTTLKYTSGEPTVAYSIGKMGATGASAQLLYLSANSETMAFDGDNVIKASQTVTITAKLQNITGSPTFSAVPYIGDVAQSAITLSGSGLSRTLTSALWTNADWDRIVVTATLGSLSDVISVNKVLDGGKGATGDAGKDGKIYTNLLQNSTWALGWDSWILNDGIKSFVSLNDPKSDKPNSRILSLEPSNLGSVTHQNNPRILVTEGLQYTIAFDIEVIPYVSDAWAFTCRIFDSPTGSNAQADAKQYYSRSLNQLGITQAVDFVRKEFTFTATVSGYMEVIPWKTSNADRITQRHRFREVMVIQGTPDQMPDVWYAHQNDLKAIQSNNQLIFNNKFIGYGALDSDSIGWYKRGSTSATHLMLPPESDFPDANIVRIPGINSNGLVTKVMPVTPGTYIQLNIPVRIPGTTPLNVSNIIYRVLFMDNNTVPWGIADSYLGTSWVDYRMNNTTGKGANITEHEFNTLISTNDTWTMTTAKILVPNGVTGVALQLFNNRGNVSYVQDYRLPQGLIFQKGNDGKGISGSPVVEYVGSTSGITKPTSGWTTTIPSVPAGSYLWSRTVTTYTDTSTSTSYSVAKMGETGLAGLDAMIISDTTPSSPKKGQLWQNSSGDQPWPVKRYDGSNWVDWGLGWGNLIVDNLSVLGYYMDVDETKGILIDNGEVRSVEVTNTTNKYRIYIGSKLSSGNISFYNKWESLDTTTATPIAEVLQTDFLFKDSQKLGNIGAYGSPNVDPALLYNAGTGTKHQFIGDLTVGGSAAVRLPGLRFTQDTKVASGGTFNTLQPTNNLVITDSKYVAVSGNNITFLKAGLIRLTMGYALSPRKVRTFLQLRSTSRGELLSSRINDFMLEGTSANSGYDSASGSALVMVNANEVCTVEAFPGNANMTGVNVLIEYI